MLFVKYRLVCDECQIEELQIKATLMENVEKEINASD